MNSTDTGSSAREIRREERRVTDETQAVSPRTAGHWKHGHCTQPSPLQWW